MESQASSSSVDSQPASLALVDRRLVFGDSVLLGPVDEQLRAEEESGVLLLHAELAREASRTVLDLGAMADLVGFTVCYRFTPFYMRPAAGTRLKSVPPETQFLLGQLGGGGWLLLSPLLGEAFRFSLRGRSDGHLELLGETGDPYLTAKRSLALLVAFGKDPFELCRTAAPIARRALGHSPPHTGSLPAFVEHFGWCTLDDRDASASADKVLAGLSSFAGGSVCPRFVLLEDGWQSVREMPTGERRLASLAANDRFDGDLTSIVREAKDGFGVETFLVSHGIGGSFGGADSEGLAAYHPVDQLRRFGEGVLAHEPACNEAWGGSVYGLIPGDHIAQFYEDLHSRLAEQGVDGVKVDNQAVLEGVATRAGGRVELAQRYRQALERSVEAHFSGRMINSMASGQETWYGASFGLNRVAGEFSPTQPESHGLHLYSNAQAGLWFGQFLHPDWGSFRSGHEWGAYHAAARAISGGPVYVADRPGEHDFDLLHKLVCSDGTVLRADGPALPTLDTLCANPTDSDAILKIWNRNGKAGVLGVFHALRYSQPVSGVVRAGDVPGLEGERFACYAHCADAVEILEPATARKISLADRGYEIFTFVPIDRGLAVLGLADKFNSSAAVQRLTWEDDSRCTFSLRDGGQLLLWCQMPPRHVQASGEPLAYKQVIKADGVELRVSITADQVGEISIEW